MEGIKRSLLFALFLIMCTLVQAQRLTVQGKVVSKTDGESIIGATVIETNQTSNGTITDIDGNFTMSVPQGAELSISYIGFKTVNVKSYTEYRSGRRIGIATGSRSHRLYYSTQGRPDRSHLRSQHRRDCQAKRKQPDQSITGTRPRYEHHSRR